jgi:enoyl-CoA hydratase
MRAAVRGSQIETRKPMATHQYLTIEEHGPVRLVTLNRPEAFNAADEALHGELATIWPELAADDQARAVVITGAGRAFCGGGDLHLLERMTGDTTLRAAIMEEAAAIVRGMTAISVPIIAAVNGPAVGLGCSLAAMSDLVLVEEHAYFSDPHVALGLVAADGGAVMWPLLTGLLRAKEYILLGDRVPAEAAVEMGLANRVVPTGTSVAAALELAARIATLPPQAVVETKALLNHAVKNAVDALLAPALTSETASFDEPAFQANLSRMLEGRPGRS